LETVTDYRLSPSLQWILDDYHLVTAVMARAIEPLVAPVIAWINAKPAWQLVPLPTLATIVLD
jgi:hypothetical protein